LNVLWFQISTIKEVLRADNDLLIYDEQEFASSVYT